MSSVETTLIDGSTVRLSREKMNSGSVESGPMTKKVMMNSSKRERERERGRAGEQRPDLRQRDLPEDLPRARRRGRPPTPRALDRGDQRGRGDQQEVREDVDEVCDGHGRQRELHVEPREVDEHARCRRTGPAA